MNILIFQEPNKEVTKAFKVIFREVNPDYSIQFVCVQKGAGNKFINDSEGNPQKFYLSYADSILYYPNSVGDIIETKSFCILHEQEQSIL